MMQQNGMPDATGKSEWTEAEAFVLYWTQYFNAPIAETALQSLWAMPRIGESVASARPPLPISNLVARGFLTTRQESCNCVSFCRAALSSEQMRRLIALADSYNWMFWTEDIIKWAVPVFPAPDGKVQPWMGMRTVGNALYRHALHRYGLRAWSWLTKAHGDGLALTSALRTMGDDALIERETRGFQAYRDERAAKSTSAGDFRNILVFPKGMTKELMAAYAVERTAPWSESQWALLCEVAHAETAPLHMGQSHLEPQTEAELVAILAAEDFMNGEPTRWAITRLNDLRTHVPLTPWATNLLLGLAFWNRDLGTIESVGVESPFCFAHKKSIASGLVRAMSREFDATASELQSALGIQHDRLENWSLVDFPVALVFFVCRFLSEKKTAGGLHRALEFIGYCAVTFGRTARRYGGNGTRLQFADLKWARTFAETIWQGLASFTVTSNSAWPKTMPFRYLRAMAILFGNADLEPHPARMLELASGLQNNGYPGLAADVAAAGRLVTSETSREASVAKAIEAAGIDPALSFAAPTTFHRPWESALDAFEKAFGLQASTHGQGAVLPVSRDEFHWVVRIITNEGRSYVSRVFAAVFPRLKNGNLGVLRILTDSKFLSGEVDGLLMAEDFELRSLLVGCGSLTTDSYSVRKRPPVTALRKLATRSGILASVEKHEGFWDSKPRPENVKFIELTWSQAKVEVRMTADGAAELVAPISFGGTEKDSDYILSRDKGRKDGWTIVETTKAYCDAARLIDMQSRGKDRIRIPSEGLDRLSDVMAAAEGRIPFVWDKNASTAPDIPREPTLCEPCVRLAYRDETLTASLSIRLSREPAWAGEPGHGLPERLVVRADKSRVLLTRDFAAEETAIAPVRDTLAPFEGAKVGETTWVFDGVEDALAALTVLHEAARNPEAKDAAPRFELEWPEGESLKLSSLVAHSARIEGGETADYWLGVSGEFTLDDGKVLSFIDLLRSFDSREGAFVRLTEGRYLRLSAALARRVEALKAAGVERGGKILISPAALPSLEKAVRETEADDTLPLPTVVRQRIETIRDAFAREFPEPDGFKCQMRPYQAEGYQWLSRLAACGIGACLADDMGLGKTIEVIALLAARRADGPSLVIAPASVTFNWRNEIARFAPGLRVALVGQTANVSADDEDVAALAKECDIVVTSYGVLTTREERFAAVDWNVVALDEAQAIKNHNTHRAKSVKTLKAKFRIVATGTPIENRLSELWSIFDFINPGMLGGEARFARELAPHGLASPRLKRLVKPLILRRLKRDVLTDLPDKEEITVPVVLGDDERHAYEATRQNAVKRLEDGDPENKIAILAELTRLRRFCCHPSLVMPSMLTSAKLDALEALLGDLKASGHRALVFSQFVDYLTIVRKMISRNGWTHQYLDGATAKSAREKAVAAFQSGEGDFFVISLKAGGMGLNLTAANYVILLDPWWNPAVESQATDRAHRIGQRLPVTVYRLIAQDTIEEKVVRLHEKKTALAEDVLADGASSLSAKAMLALLEG